MSRREDRGSESKRRHSRFDREPSPKRSRRDGKPETERPPTQPELDKDQPERHRRRLQDPLPLDAHGSKVESVNMGRESEMEEASKYSSHPTKVPLSRSYFQHDDRGSAGQNGRSVNRRTDSERGWWRDPKDQQNDRTINRTISSDTHQKDEKSKDSREGNLVWRHDGYFEMEANPKPPVRKRPAFREQKIPADQEKTNKAAGDLVMPNPQGRGGESGRRNERGHNSRHSDKPERPVSGERAQSWRGNFSSRDRYSANNRYRSGDRFSARQGQDYHPIGGRVEKWKHDLYDEASKSPPQRTKKIRFQRLKLS